MSAQHPRSQYLKGTLRSENKVRALSTAELGISIPQPEFDELEAKSAESQYEQLDVSIEDSDPLLAKVRILLGDGYAGVILTGPPGTGKSWYAAQIAARLANLKSDLVRFIQFHPSYQYEDFVEGFVPVEGQGFELRGKHLLEMCDKARDARGETCVLVIDELSRSDPSRVFGEALTYIEMTKRDQLFRLASGRLTSIPPNLIFVTTMNPWDRGVDEVDAAFERRFAKIAMDPSAAMLETFLINNGMEEGLRDRVVRFFEHLQRIENPYCHIGHAYFYSVKDEAGLERLWEFQLRFLFEKAFRLDREGYKTVDAAWRRVFVSASTAGGGPSDVRGDDSLR